jgi:hypothetical protein
LVTQRYSLIKIWKSEDLPILRWKIDDIKKEIENITEIWEVWINAWLTDNWYVFVKWTSIHVDDLINSELRKTDWEIAQLRQIDLKWISNQEKQKIYQNLKWANLAKNVWNIRAKLYEDVFPALKWFFNDYQIETVDWISLPRLLWQTNATQHLSDDNFIPTDIDKIIKRNILEEISPIIREWNLNRDELTKKVTFAIDQFYLKTETIPEWFKVDDVIGAYVDVFAPYELLVKIPNNMVEDYYKWLC